MFGFTICTESMSLWVQRTAVTWWNMDAGQVGDSKWGMFSFSIHIVSRRIRLTESVKWKMRVSTAAL